MDFITAAANIRAHIYGIAECREQSKIISYVQKVNVPVFKPKDGVRIDVTESEAQARNSSAVADTVVVQELRETLFNIRKLLVFFNYYSYQFRLCKCKH